MTTAPCCDVELGLDVALGLDAESLRLVASEPPAPNVEQLRYQTLPIRSTCGHYHSFGMRRVELLALAIGLVGCFAAPTPTGPVFSSIDSPWTGRALTRDGSDTYSLVGSATVSAAASNSGGNTRTVWWDGSQSVLTDEQSCATWVSETNAINQQGAALRVTNDRAITVTKNIYLYGTWIFNVHVWDSSGGTQLASFDLGSVFRPPGNNVVALPWDLCARVIGGTLTFIAWVDGQSQPTWGDTSHGGTVTLPGGWVYAGSAGFYTGHLQPSDDAVFSNLAAGPISNIPMPSGAAHTETVSPSAGPPPKYAPTYP